MPYDDKDRRKVDAAFRRALGMRLKDYHTTRAYGFPEDEAGSITLVFEGSYDPEVTFTIELSPTGYEADGIYVRPISP